MPTVSQTITALTGHPGFMSKNIIEICDILSRGDEQNAILLKIKNSPLFLLRKKNSRILLHLPYLI